MRNAETLLKRNNQSLQAVGVGQQLVFWFKVNSWGHIRMNVAPLLRLEAF